MFLCFFFKIQKRDFLDTFFESLLAFSRTLHAQTFRAGFKGGASGPPTKPFVFYFSLMIDANETTT